MKTHKSIYYYATWKEAEQVRQDLGCKHVREYERGFAVQLHDSGAYVGTEINTPEQVKQHRCGWCSAE